MRVRIISKHGSYKGRYFDKIGTIFSCDYADEYSKSNTIGVKLDNINNPASKHNCFWFQRNEIEIIITNITNTEEENMGNNEPIVKIINYWRDNQQALLSEEYQDIYETKIIQTDPKISILRNLTTDFTKKLSEFQKEYDANFKPFVFDVIKDLYKGVTLSHESALLVEKLNSKKISFECQINKFAQEALMMVSACETYEQQMEVLERYNIVRNNLKLNNDAQFELNLD